MRFRRRPGHRRPKCERAAPRPPVVPPAPGLLPPSWAATGHQQPEGVAGTDWPQTLGLYGLLGQVASSPVVTLNRAVAAATARPQGSRCSTIDTGSGPLVDHHRVRTVWAHLLEPAGDIPSALVH
ncbi:hypothetical protein ACIBBE_21620 [Streptomyces sp. NPDC051644]|uniref:hypothetical protein n=1 Tax=Streptomyces sp. NPDC051644 TaxID=3365666 RepID=UPI0037B65058